MWTYEQSSGRMLDKAEARRERLRKAAARWRERHPEKARQVGRDSMLRWRTLRREEWLVTKRRWNAANPERVAKYARRALCKKHGMTLGRYSELLAQQGGVCAICGNADKEKPHLGIDHDHRCCAGQFSCGKCVRGLLCNKCNQAIGCLRDDYGLLLKAAAYLEASRK